MFMPASDGNPVLACPDHVDGVAWVVLEGAELATGYRLHQRFRQLIGTRDHAALDTRLADTLATNRPPCVSLVRGIQAHRAAIDAAFTTAWSHGPVEGHVPRPSSCSSAKARGAPNSTCGGAACSQPESKPDRTGSGRPGLGSFSLSAGEADLAHLFDWNVCHLSHGVVSECPGPAPTHRTAGCPTGACQWPTRV